MEVSNVAVEQNVNVINLDKHKIKGISDRSWEINERRGNDKSRTTSSTYLVEEFGGLKMN